MMKRIVFVVALSCAVMAADGYRLLKKFPVPGEGGWDYLTVDAAARRLYVSHSSEVNVLDADSGAVVGSIPGKGIHGIALAPEFGRGYITNGGSDNLTVFDMKTLKPLGDVATGKKPDAILYDPATKRVFANNGGSDSSTVVNAADGAVLGTVDLGGGPEASASDGSGFVFTNLEDKSEMVKIDAKAMKVVARWNLAPCEQPSALAMDRAGRRLFAGCRNHTMAVVDADSGKVVFTAPIGDHVDAAAFEAATKMVFLSNGDGTLNVFHEDSPNRLSAVETVQTQSGAKTMALDTKTHNVYLSAAEYAANNAAKKGRSVKPGSFAVLVVGKY
jgi:DNA-binding beta-propeller fold protein YncE